MSKALHYLNIFVMSVALMIALSIGINLLLKDIQPVIFKFTMHAALSLVIGCVFFIRIQSSLKELKIESIHLGNFKTTGGGFLIGVVISIITGIGFGLFNNLPFEFSQLSNKLALVMLAQIFPAVVEEVVFRGGIVHASTKLWGTWVGLASGSVPFGILHMVDILFGNSITPMHVFGIILGGLLLSLIYLRLGLFAAIACHYAWNVLATRWQKGYGFSDMGDFEGSWVACVVLLVVTIALWKAPKLDPKAEL